MKDTRVRSELRTVPLVLSRDLYTLVKAYDEWLVDEIDDAELIEEVASFARKWKHGDRGEAP